MFERNTVVVLGAGATAACKGPLTDAIIPNVFELRGKLKDQDSIDLVEQFLSERFGLPANRNLKEYPYPGLPLLLSLLDNAIHRGDSFGASWPVDRVRVLRESVEQIIFEVIELKSQSPTELHDRLIDKFGEQPTFISLNYDLLVDYALMRKGGNLLPDYGCDVAAADGVTGTFGVLLKIHGSLNWRYCATCHHLEVGTTDTGPHLANVASVQAKGALCSGTRGGVPCRTRMRRVLITPSHMKDYRNPHIANIWRRAEDALRNAQRVIFIGYSLPWDDVEVIYLLKRGLAHLTAAQITVVEYHWEEKCRAIEAHDAGKRYRAIFGNVDWHGAGFEEWLKNG